MYYSTCAFYVNGRKERSYAEELGNAKTKIKMELNLKKGQLIYYKNGKSFGVASQIRKGEDIEYKMAVTLHWPGAKFKLINFQYL